jgi:signal transduction histidine kinase
MLRTNQSSAAPTERGSWREHPAGWALALAAATLASLLIATQNFAALSAAGRRVGWLRLALLELPVWFSWVALSPAIFAAARRFPILGPRWPRNLLVHLPLSAATVFLSLALALGARWPFIQGELPPETTYVELVLASFRNYFAAFMTVYFAIVAFHQARTYYRESRAKAVRESQLEAQLAQAQLHTLRMQLHPHFLFNTLHMISALMARDVPTARRMIARLSDLLRLSLQGGERHEISLDEELEFLDYYVDIQRLRFRDRLKVVYDVQPEARALLVPRLMLQPLVENAIVHGLASEQGQHRIEVVARRVDGRLEMKVTDSGSGIAPGTTPREGVGLGSTRARLEQLYDGEQRLELRNRPEGGVEVTIAIPARSDTDIEP